MLLEGEFFWVFEVLVRDKVQERYFVGLGKLRVGCFN